MSLISFNRPQKNADNNAPRPVKDITVRIVSVSNDQPAKHINVVNEADIIKDYSDEAKLSKPINLAQGLTIGAGIGILVCAIASITGVSLNIGDMAAMIGVPAVLGIVAGYILS